MKEPKNTKPISVSEATKIVKDADISVEGDLTFKAAVIVFIGSNYNWDLDEIYKATKYSYDDCATILKNFYENNIIEGGKLNINVTESELENTIELTLVAMCGSGELVRREEIENIDKTHNFEKMPSKKTLNEHLFDTLDRLSIATQENVELEITKAASIVTVSEQILSVSRFKLDIINSQVQEQFTEIAIIQTSPLIENDNVPEEINSEEEQDELVSYGGRMISKKALGNHKHTTVPAEP